MSGLPVIAIFDVGRTNKKLFLFDEQYQIVFEKSSHFDEILDEDGFPCENLEKLRLYILNSLREIFSLVQFKIIAVNFSGYGASLVYLDKNGNPLTPLYNYLKPYPAELSDRFYSTYESRETFSLQTASPVLGSLNAGLQLYRFKYEQPERFKNLLYALHLPQYLSFLMTGSYYSDLTSIGCHTALWDFNHQAYHSWVAKEELVNYLAPVQSADKLFASGLTAIECKAGIGLHDSSAALIPYLVSFSMPFVLISTGTWNISMNPFNKAPLTADDLKSDCLCYLQYGGKPVKASRLHAGLEHERQVKRIAEYFSQDIAKYREVIFDSELVKNQKSNSTGNVSWSEGFTFHKRDLADFKTDVEAYHQLVSGLVDLQFLSTQLVMRGSGIKRIFVDGGFSHNSLFMHLLANAFPEIEVFAASMAQATALGVALVIHSGWNTQPIPRDIITLRHYAASGPVPN